MFTYAFIGAGPSTLSAVANLSKEDRAASIVVEAGFRGKREICPSLKKTSCSSCFEKKCHVINGVGGASAMFGNKYCEFPASEGVRDLMFFGDSEGNCTSGVQKPNDRVVVPHPGVPNRKVYDVSIALSGEYRKKINLLVEDVLSTTPILEGWVVESIKRRGAKLFQLISSAGDIIEAENVVIGSGRSGHKELRRWMEQLSIEYSENSPDIGVRIEVPTEAISQQFLYQDDPKFKFDFGKLGQARTFCTCKGGQIVPVKFGEGCFADGAFMRKDTGRTNVALMVRTGEKFDPIAIEKWCASVNSSRRGSLLLGQLNSFSSQDPDLEKSVLDLIPEGPSVTYRKTMQALLQKLLTDNACMLFTSNIEVLGPLKIYGPSIDLYWPKVELSRGFKTTVDGVYVIGDAAGVSRGIVQAIAAGKSWARTVSRNSLKDVALW